MDETIRTVGAAGNAGAASIDDLVPRGDGAAAIGEIPVRDIIASTKPRNGSVRVKLYDFRRPDKFSRDQLRTLAVIHERLARAYTATLSGLLRNRCELRVRSVDQMTLDEFASTLRPTHVAGVISLSPLPTGFLFALGGDAAGALLEVMAGAQEAGSVADRQVTELERGALSALFGNLADDLAEAWKPVTEVEGRFVALEPDARNVRLVPPQDMIVLVEFDLSVGEYSGAMRFALPFLLLEPVLFELSAENFYFPKKDRRRSPKSLRRVSGLPLASSLFYDAGTLSLAELASLKRGDLVPLAEDGTLVFEAGGRPLLRMAASSRGAFAVTAALGDLGPVGGGAADPAAQDADRPVDASAALARIAAEMAEAFSRLDRKLEEVAVRQNELADQIFFGGDGASGGAGEGAERPLAFAADLDRGRFARFLSSERPQTAALVLSGLDPAPAGDLLSRLPEDVQGDVVRRIARIGAASPLMIAEIASCLRRRRDLARGERTGLAGVGELLAEMAAAAASPKTAAIIADALAAVGSSPVPAAGKSGRPEGRS